MIQQGHEARLLHLRDVASLEILIGNLLLGLSELLLRVPFKLLGRCPWRRKSLGQLHKQKEEKTLDKINGGGYVLEPSHVGYVVVDVLAEGVILGRPRKISVQCFHR